MHRLHHAWLQQPTVKAQAAVALEYSLQLMVTSHPNMNPSPQTDMVGPSCTGGVFSVAAPHNSGMGTVPIAGSIPCGTPASITVTENGCPDRDLTTAACP